MINLKVKDAQEIASYFLFKINNFSFNPKETAEALFQFMDDSFHLLPLIYNIWKSGIEHSPIFLIFSAMLENTMI